MEEKLQKYADDLIDLLRAGADFAGEQAPLFVQELLTYYTYHHSVYLAIGVFFLTLSWVFKRRVANSSQNDYAITVEGNGFLCAVSFVLGTIIVVYHLLALIQVTVAPRLYLIETLQSMV